MSIGLGSTYSIKRRKILETQNLASLLHGYNGRGGRGNFMPPPAGAQIDVMQ